MTQQKNRNPGIVNDTAAKVVNNSAASRAHTRTCVVRPTGIQNESLLALPGARVRAHAKRDFAAWRIRKFGGDFDPVREAVEDAVAAFSGSQPERDRLLWLKIANEIGYEMFQELYFEQCSIMQGCTLRNPAAAFQNRLNRFTGHNSGKSDTAKPDAQQSSCPEKQEQSYDCYDNAANMSMDEAYTYCRKLENDRDRKHRDSKIGKIESSILSLDELMGSFDDPSKIGILSDNGKGRSDIHASERHEAASVALNRLTPDDRKFAQAILDGKSWQEMGIPRTTFYRRLKNIENFLAR